MIMRFVITVLLLFVVSSGKAQAQLNDRVLLAAPKPLADFYSIRDETDKDSFKPVAQRIPEDYIADPIHWRGFQITPLLDSTQSVNTNIYATENNTETDTITTLAPSILVAKEFGRHKATLSVGAQAKKYWSNSDEDVLNAETKFRATLEARHDITLPFEMTVLRGHENRTQNLSSAFSKEPIAFNSFGSALGIVYNPNRLTLSAIGRYSDIAFDNGQSRTGQAVIRDDGDKSSQDLELRAAYQFLPNHQPYITVNIGKTDFERADHNGISYAGPKRDSKNFGFLAGWQLSYKGLIQATLGAGYGSRRYDDSQIDDVETFRVASNIAWNISRKATLNLGFRRAITEDNQVLQGIVMTQGRFQLDYEILHNLFYNAFVDYAFADFEGITREDDNLSAGTGLRYIISPRFSLSGDYNYTERDSSAVGASFDQHEFMARLHTKF